MFLNYIDSLGNIKNFYINGLFLKNFFNLNILYQFMLYYNLFYRINKSAQKNRSQVNFSTKKIYKQKGTGKSRAGSLSSPLRIKGGRSFPNLYYIKYKINFNRSCYKFSFFIIYSNIILNSFFYIIEDLFFFEFKTKFSKYTFDFNYNFIFLTIKIEKNFLLSSKNFKFIKIIYFFNFNPLLLIKNYKIFITRSCFEYFLNV
ncbi:50S ribosomal subunit protein L4 [Candidatus Nasuia deltocephalinicola str. NAS-ALF]|uniref:Large ribosomal subunit protein uL4 n=1 Tax=Candidatus Nasuia deltocephalinicola str. NAS-ALF TaxID=1343077 RepID=S5SQB0_9PROT|nr:50S ribosomal subunit protein L4 [Candidatus Nasuia deltocephalinicola str. NAS-ALF]